MNMNVNVNEVLKIQSTRPVMDEALLKEHDDK